MWCAVDVIANHTGFTTPPLGLGPDTEDDGDDDNGEGIGDDTDEADGGGGDASERSGSTIKNALSGVSWNATQQASVNS